MTKSKRKVIRYSISFKQKVVNEIEQEGLQISEANRRYGIGGAETINKWLKELGKQHLLNTVIRVETKDEKDRLLELEKEVKKLKLALADAYLSRDCAEEVIRQAGKLYGTDLKKKFGTAASDSSGSDTR
ncbi:transposase [Mucilaginibacter sp. KACC 22773]|jgi:transposase-like protein|uniref:transposase n=1 Tax=Mucilaginibacter sp. KACC 22773 TaxID=3025671 RepID=UPI0023673F4B|nr:transposase [Mucilaginibacter sp. KACC 22773]WDF76097.1 transposase [Mucilaginibacter sp. KACC 22773]WDF76226.1 transposase [Mucilaginibacter sp. KACC 22773]WDF77890.1 transposase [Mucilaginibacter sp. KACC 22773]WDF79988.1 transposase [Mucilaginibacter sp. KACC 22773]